MVIKAGRVVSLAQQQGSETAKCNDADDIGLQDDRYVLRQLFDFVIQYAALPVCSIRLRRSDH
jgi:hypothetical protein